MHLECISFSTPSTFAFTQIVIYIQSKKSEPFSAAPQCPYGSYCNELMKKECYHGNLEGYRIQTTTLLEEGMNF